MKRHAFASLICLPLAACVDEAEPETENLSTTESNLCTDGLPDAVVAFQDHNGFSGATSASPTSSYDRAACADRFTVEVTGVSSATQPFEIAGGWGEPLPVSEDICTLAFANVQAQEYKATSWNCNGNFCFPTYSWQNVGNEISLHGEWVAGFGNTHDCVLVPSAPLPTLQPYVFRSKVRDTMWLGLEIVATERGREADETGIVEFIARGAARGQPFAQRERSRFRKLEDRWVYVDGTVKRV